MSAEPAPASSVESTRGWEPKGYLAWLEAKTLVRGRYELLSYLGSGRVGSVFAAQHLGFDERVALKFLQPRYLASADTAEHFIREARAGFTLRSEHIARVYDVDVHEGVPFIATEMLEGETLRALLTRRGALGRATSVDYALQVCEALACAHARGSVHFDLTPENLFVLGDEHIKLVDFGLAQIAAADGGSLYAAPEPVRASSAADLWSLGCVLYELLSGRAAFATRAAVLEEQPVPLTTLPDGLWPVLQRCFQKAPDARWADVAELAAALEPFGSGRYNGYADRCRSTLRPDAAPPSTAAAVAVQPTMVLGQTGATEHRKPLSRTATLACDVSAFASPVEAVRELEAASPRPPLEKPARELEAASPRPAPEKPAAPPSRPTGLLLLTAALFGMAWGGFALWSGPAKPVESPKLMHLVTPLKK